MKQSCYFNHTQAFMKKTIFKSLNFFCMKKKSLFIVHCSLFIFFLAANGQEQERFIRYHTDIVIETDGTIVVTDNIKLYAGGIEIKRGIIREIPLYRRDAKGKNIKIDIKVLSVTCNGEKTKYNVTNRNRFLEVATGDNTFLEHGVYEYAITYSSRGHIGFFDGYDELYWNVTGFNDFVIEQASATITLPEGATAISADAYTGIKGATEKDFLVDDHGAEQTFTATRLFQPLEGMTIAVGFTPDIIQRPPPPTELEQFWEDKKHHICGLVILTLFGFYFLITFLATGMKPDKPVVIPTFTPPYDWSPATVNYLVKKRYNNKAFSASLVEMAVKGAVGIDCDPEGAYTIVNKHKTEGLKPVEQNVYKSLFLIDKEERNRMVERIKKISPSTADKTLLQNILNEDRPLEQLKVNRMNGKLLWYSSDSLERNLSAGWNLDKFFRFNRTLCVIGGILIPILMIMNMMLTLDDETFHGLLFAIPVLLLGYFEMLRVGFKKEFGFAAILMYLFISIYYLFHIYTMVHDPSDPLDVHWQQAGYFVLLTMAYFLYTRLIQTHTLLGAVTSAALEGFRMYMKTAEEHRLNILTPPAKTPELFEKLLPYAIALGVSNEWCEKFDSVLKKFNYSPVWYTSPEPFDARKLNRRFGAMNTSLSPYTRSGKNGLSGSSSGSGRWSSGSRGGGHSGGGGGGGRTRGR